MQDVLDRAARQQTTGVRLLQSGFHNRSLCLYTKLGFCTVSPCRSSRGSRLGGSSQATRSVLRWPLTWPLVTESAFRSMDFIVRANCGTRSNSGQLRSLNILGALLATRPGSLFSATASRRLTAI